MDYKRVSACYIFVSDCLCKFAPGMLTSRALSGVKSLVFRYFFDIILVDVYQEKCDLIRKNHI